MDCFGTWKEIQVIEVFFPVTERRRGARRGHPPNVMPTANQISENLQFA